MSYIPGVSYVLKRNPLENMLLSTSIRMQISEFWRPKLYIFIMVKRGNESTKGAWVKAFYITIQNIQNMVHMERRRFRFPIEWMLCTVSVLYSVHAFLVQTVRRVALFFFCRAWYLIVWYYKVRVELEALVRIWILFKVCCCGAWFVFMLYLYCFENA